MWRKRELARFAHLEKREKDPVHKPSPPREKTVSELEALGPEEKQFTTHYLTEVLPNCPEEEEARIMEQADALSKIVDQKNKSARASAPSGSIMSLAEQNHKTTTAASGAATPQPVPAFRSPWLALLGRTR